MKFRRISKKWAFERFCQNRPIYLCPCNIVPDGPWSMACLVYGKEYLEQAAGYADGHIPELWEGTVEKTAWSLMYNNWRFYNASCETGYYAHYYVQD